MKTKMKLKISAKDVIVHSADKMHLDAQIRFPSTIVESKKHKKPKYPKKYLDDINV